MGKSKDKRWKGLKKIVEAELKAADVPGCAVGILHEGKFKTAGFGVANVESGQRVNADTAFQIGSITKTFTATLVMQLVEEGKLDLNATVRTYLPDFKVADEETSAKVTLHHLLTHSAGWDGDLFLDTGEGADAIHEYVERIAEREQVFPLGEHVSYNNSGYAMLGSVLEVVAETSFETLLKERILEPLGMKKSFLSAAETVTHDFSVGHHKGPVVARPWHLQRNVLPMGALVMSTHDLLTYAQCYLDGGKYGEGERMLKAKTIKQMFAGEKTIWDLDGTQMGLCWFRRKVEGGTLNSHGGGTNGQVSQLMLFPDHDFALAIFTNSDLGARVIGKIYKYVLKEYLDLEIKLPERIESTPEDLKKFEGVISRPGVEVQLAMVGEMLVGADKYTTGFPTENDPPPPSPPPYSLGRCEEDRLIVLDGDGKDIVFDVFRDDDGEIQYMRMGLRMYHFEKS